MSDIVTNHKADWTKKVIESSGPYSTIFPQPLLENQLRAVEENMIYLSQKQDHYLTTITGISDVTGAVILLKLGGFNRSERPEQLVAPVHQSIDFTSTRIRISKPSSSHLRQAIFQVAFVPSNRYSTCRSITKSSEQETKLMAQLSVQSLASSHISSLR